MPAIVAWIVGTVLAGVGVAVVAWALFADAMNPYRPRRRCPCCWHDLGQVPGLRCPECGHEARGEAALKRARRRWRWAGVGLSAFVSGGVAVTLALTPAPRVVNAVPEWCLPAIQLLPRSSQLHQEARSRAESIERIREENAEIGESDQAKAERVRLHFADRSSSGFAPSISAWARRPLQFPETTEMLFTLAARKHKPGSDWASHQLRWMVSDNPLFLHAQIKRLCQDLRSFDDATIGVLSSDRAQIETELVQLNPKDSWSVVEDMIWRHDPDAGSAALLAEILQLHRSDATIPMQLVRELISSDDPRFIALGLQIDAVRDEAIGVDTRARISELLVSTSVKLRRLSEAAIRHVPSREWPIIEPLILRALGDLDVDVRHTAARSLWHNACQLSPAGLRTLIAATDDPVAANAQHIRSLLQNCRSVAMEDALCDALGDDRPAVEYTAVEALVDRGSWLVLPSTLDRLAEVSNDPRRSALVRELATRALLNYAKQRFGLEF